MAAAAVTIIDGHCFFSPQHAESGVRMRQRRWRCRRRSRVNFILLPQLPQLPQLLLPARPPLPLPAPLPQPVLVQPPAGLQARAHAPEEWR